MKILKGIIYFLLGLFILFAGFVVICAFNPDLTKAIAEFLYPESGSVPDPIVTEEMVSDTPETDYIFNENGNQDVELPGEGTFGVDSEGESLEGYSGESGNDGMEEGIVSGYIPPEQSAVIIPENVSGRNGYQQIQDEQEQVDEDTARQIQEQLGTGHTGDGLDFDALYYPYYAMLSEKGQHIYRQIYANGSECYQTFAPVEPVTAKELKNIFSAVYNDHPELFWMDTAYAGKYARNGLCVEIDLQFNRTAQDLERAKAQFHESADQILSGAQAVSGNYDREKFVHDALIDRIDYNMGAQMNQSAYSALVNGQTVCAGYARAFQYLMQQLGVPCYYCTGFAGESHAWNIIMLEDGFYNVDTTWDDTDGGTYDYFNKTDADYAGSHIRRELSVYLPLCSGEMYRNLEPETETEDSRLRSLADTGLAEEKVFANMQGYYGDCYNQILLNRRGSYTFYNVIEGEELAAEWYRNYQNEYYRQAYMDNAMTELGAVSCEMALEVEELQGGRYLIRHDLSVQ